MLHFSWIVCSLICLSLAFLRLYRVHIQTDYWPGRFMWPDIGDFGYHGWFFSPDTASRSVCSHHSEVSELTTPSDWLHVTSNSLSILKNLKRTWKLKLMNKCSGMGGLCSRKCSTSKLQRNSTWVNCTVFKFFTATAPNIGFHSPWWLLKHFCP